MREPKDSFRKRTLLPRLPRRLGDVRLLLHLLRDVTDERWGNEQRRGGLAAALEEVELVAREAEVLGGVLDVRGHHLR